MPRTGRVFGRTASRRQVVTSRMAGVTEGEELGQPVVLSTSAGGREGESGDLVN